VQISHLRALGLMVAVSAIAVVATMYTVPALPDDIVMIVLWLFYPLRMLLRVGNQLTSFVIKAVNKVW
jgi:hypothetical protein